MSTDLNKNLMAERLKEAEGKQKGFIERHMDTLAAGGVLFGVSSIAYSFVNLISASANNLASSWIPALGVASLLGTAALAVYSVHLDKKFNSVIADPLKHWDKSKDAVLVTNPVIDYATIDLPGVGNLNYKELDYFSLPELKEITSTINTDLSKSKGFRYLIESTRHASHIEELFSANGKDVDSFISKALSNTPDKEMATSLGQRIFGHENGEEISNNQLRNDKSNSPQLSIE